MKELMKKLLLLPSLLIESLKKYVEIKGITTSKEMLFLSQLESSQP